MLQHQVFPMAAALPSPAERISNRERYSTLLSITLYVLFMFLPGATVGLSIVLGRAYGLSVYRFFVSWLFFFVTGLLTLDPFIVRYRTQLSDLIHHWRKVFPCTKTCLTVSFEHGILYFGMLWSLSYAFVFIEAILALFWNLEAAIQLTTFAFGTCLVIYLVMWIGRIVKQHSHLTFSNHQQHRETDIHLDRFVRVPVKLSDEKAVEVRLSKDPKLELNPEIKLTEGARMDLTDHLRRNNQQLTISGNVMTVEPLDALTRQFRCYRALTWSLLVLLGGFVLALVLRSSFHLFELDAWVIYVSTISFVVVVLLLVFFFGRQFSDPTYLQFFLLLSTFFPTFYGAWLIEIYTDYVAKTSFTDNHNSSLATLIMLLHLALSQLYSVLTGLIIRHFSAPYLYVRFLILPQIMAYAFEYVIFGFTPWSNQYLLVLMFCSAHNIMSSTGLYFDLWRLFRKHCWPIPVPPSPRRSVEKRLFEQLLRTRYSMQLFAQDTIADVWSLVVVLTMLMVLYLFHVPILEILPNFTLQPIMLRLAVLFVARVFSWMCGQIIFRYKITLTDSSNRLAAVVASANASVAPKSLTERLDDYLSDFKLSVFQTAELRACYEEDMPELFVSPSNAQPQAEDVVLPRDLSKLSSRELIVMQIAERQWLLHPALLRKHFMYFHAAMYLLLFIVLQAVSGSLPLRYAWFKD